jgi:lysine-specific demethylase 8
VEIGGSYVEKDWTQKLMTLADFIDLYVVEDGSSKPKGYLAQTQLFDQIPELQKDIVTPDYCALSGGDEELLIVNAWFGPKGTVSPAHYDPYHNLLSQVVGEKYIKLFSPLFTPHLYPHQDKLLFNTSQVNVENADLQQFPLYAEANYLECVLSSGEMLYIPPKWWHYVRSLSISFSVSFWWQ